MTLVIFLPILVYCLQVEGRSVASEEYLDLLYMDYFLEDIQLETHTEENLLPLDSHQEECINDLNLDREMIAYISTQEFPPEDDRNCNEYFSCSWKKQGYQFQNGKINYNALEEMWFDSLCKQAGTTSGGVSLAKQMAKLSVDDCRHVGGDSDGQTAVKVHNCIYRRLLDLAREHKSSDSSKLSR